MENIGFNGGMPYEIDAKLLREAFPIESLTEGRIISHDELTAVLGMPPDHQRYRPVINHWIKKMWEEGRKKIITVRKEGIQVADDKTKMKHTEHEVTLKAKLFAKKGKEIIKVDPMKLTPTDRQLYDRNTRIIFATSNALRDARKQIALPVVPPVGSTAKRQLTEKQKEILEKTAGS